MKCIKCSKDHTGSFGSGKYCSRACANSRTFTNEAIEKKRRASLGKDPWNKGLKYTNSDISGENNPASKLTLNQVSEIRNEFDNSRGIYVKLSKKYNVSTACIRKIVKGKTWKE